MLTTVVTFLSKYFSKAKEKRNNEKIEIKTDGIKVNKANTVIYFLLDFKPSLSISVLIALLISKKINIKKEVNRRILTIKRYCKFLSVSLIKPLSIKVKNVKKPIDNVIINNIIKKMFFLIKSVT